MTKKLQKKRSLLSGKRLHSITQSHETKPTPKTLKPLRARQLIRRFHVLLKYKSAILSKLSQLKSVDTETYEDFSVDYKKWIYKQPKLKKIYETEWKNTWDKLKVNKTPDSVIDPKSNDVIDNSVTIEELVKLVGKIDSETEKRGGLETYQTASTLGQDAQRGGDSSKILTKWLSELGWGFPECSALEIGCLSSKNMISKCGVFDVIKRIDLHSQEPGVIEEQDFLKLPSPTSESNKFDCVSCSLVVNFVPSPELRGEMMCKMCEFLKNPTGERHSLLFFVLPLPCVENSRYCDLNTINLIWSKLGFKTLKYHQSNKLAYWLLKWEGESKVDKTFTVKKNEIRKGNNRNNFCVVIK